ncbi:MAG: efflux RND transporter periplasmic adaptor subunit [Vicinamibacterales bacterium]
MTYRIFTGSALVLGCASLLAACGGGTASPQNRRPGGASVAIQTTTTKRITVQRQVDLAGTLLAPDQAKVSAEAAGVVRSVAVEIGREVRVGDPLVTLEPRELTLAMARAESALRQTRAQLGMSDPLADGDAPPPDEQIGSVKNALANREDARANLERAETLSKRGLLPPAEMQAADTRLKVAEAGYQSAVDNVRGQKALLQDRRAAYDLAAKKVADAVVRAPISGVVSERPVNVGEYIAERTPVVTIVKVNPLKLRTGVQERHAGIVQPGQAVEFRVESFGDTLFHGKVAYVSPALDETMRTFTVEALVDNADLRLKPGFFAKGMILTRKDEGVLAVPDAAVSTLAGVSSVYIVSEGKIAQKSVTLGVRQGDLWEVVEGLKGEETLAASRLNELATGIGVTTGAEGEGRGGGRRGGEANGGRRGQRGDTK